MQREPAIPLFLWIATAILVHLGGGGGVHVGARVMEELREMQRFARSVQLTLRASGTTMEVALLEDSELLDPREEPAPDPSREKQPIEQEEQEPDEQIDETADRDDEQAKKDAPHPEAEPPKPKPEPTEKEKPKPDPAEEAKPPEDLPKVQIKNRIAVKQHAEPNQQDNPNAEFIADEANKVEQETQARITAADQDDPDPTPGAQHAGSENQPGNAEESRIAQSEDSPGEADRAPTDEAQGEEKPASKPLPASAGSPDGKRAESASSASSEDRPGHRAGDERARLAGRLPGQRGQTAREATREVPGMPETLHSPGGSSDLPAAREAKKAQKARSAQKKRLPPAREKRASWDYLGLGSARTTAGGINLNLDYAGALATVGVDKLSQARRADGERRRSAHRGSWKSGGIERWRAAIENYVSSVKPGNQTALNTARVPFASYLNQIHNRLHPIFADSFLGSLDSLPGDHPMNKADIKTNLEIVLSQEDGRVVKMGITRTSGVTAFDIAALESVHRAQPFGVPPKIIVSPDGNVYLHWEFHRNPYYACSTYFARPYLLKAKPESAPPRIREPAPPPFRPREREIPGEQRHGSLPLPPRG
jgi:hypothetical protein